MQAHASATGAYERRNANPKTGAPGIRHRLDINEISQVSASHAKWLWQMP